jgi:hypothetical protein
VPVNPLHNLDGQDTAGGCLVLPAKAAMGATTTALLHS